jgi:hypothetical protein
MGEKKQLTPVIDPTAGLNVSANPIYLPPGAMVDGENWIIAKPAGFKTTLSEFGHALQTRPPIKQSFTSAFDFSVFPTATEVKPLVGKTATPSDSVPAQWQRIAVGLLSEGWVSSTSSGGVADVLTEVSPGFTSSDGNNIALALGVNDSGNAVTNGDHEMHVTLSTPYTKGLVGNFNTKIYVDYTELYRSPGGAFGCVTLQLRVGTDASNYLVFLLNCNANATGALLYAQFKYNNNLRNYDSIVGTKSFGEIVNNLVYIQFFAISSHVTEIGSLNTYTMFTIDNVRLDVDYSGFFGDFKVGQAYKQVTLDTLDLTSILEPPAWTLSGGFYPERRLSIGNGCLAWESQTNTADAISKTLTTPIDTTVSGFPTYILVDYRVEDYTHLTALTIRVGSDASNYKTITIAPAANGNGVFYHLFSSLASTGSPNLASIAYIRIAAQGDGTAEQNSPRVYLNNIRFAPYTNSPGFPAQSGNIRDLTIYEATNGGASDYFIAACGDTLFLGGNGLVSTSFYIQGGFTNWTPPSHVFDQPFVGVIAANPAYAGTGVAAKGSFAFSGQPTAGDQLVINNTAFTFVASGTSVVQPNQIIMGASAAATVQNAAITITAFFVSAYLATVNALVNTTLDIVASAVGVFANTIPLSYVGSVATVSGATLLGGIDPFGQPQNLEVIVNGKDGILTVGIIQYPIGGGNVYSYPVVNQVDKRPFSSVEIFNGRVMASGDPANPNNIYFSDDEDCTKYQPGNFIPLDLQGVITTGDSIKAIRKYEDVMIIGRSTGAFVLYGDSPYNYSIKQTSANFGPISSRHILIANRRVFFLGFDGVYEFANYQTKKISDPIDSVFKTNDMNIIRSSFLSYNPIRQILIVNLIHEYMNDPIVGLGAGTYSVERYIYSLEKSVWSRMRALQDLSIFNPFSAVYFGGENQAPAFYESSLTLLEWDNGPDSATTVCTAKFAPVNCGNPHQIKTFDKMLMHALNMPSSGFTLGYSMRLDFPSNTNLIGTSYDDNDGYIEEEFDSGIIARQVSIQVQTTVQNGALTLDQNGMYTLDQNGQYTINNQDGDGDVLDISQQTPCLLLAYRLSYFNGEQI